MILHLGDCRDVLPTLRADSVDSVVCDPPYELNFMGAGWDRTGVAFDVDMWRSTLRVAKPGAWLVAFGGTRTFHRLTVAIEDAGWEIRDCMMWLYGQGFPKSRNGPWGGTALKPGWEPIVLARKPFKGTVAQCFEEFGTSALNIDGARIGWDPKALANDTARRAAPRTNIRGGALHAGGGEAAAYRGEQKSPPGRWPANVLLTHAEECKLVGKRRVRANGSITGQEPSAVAKNALGKRARVPFQAHGENGIEVVGDWRCVDGCPVRLLDEQSGDRPGMSGGGKHADNYAGGLFGAIDSTSTARGDRGGASRFFYCGKTTKKDRGEGNDHPTVKPSKLIEYLIPLITPSGGTVLDHFMGSGTTGKAAHLLGYSFIGITDERRHFDIAKARLKAAVPGECVVPVRSAHAEAACTSTRRDPT